MTGKELAPHQQRVVLECTELHEKLVALRNFTLTEFFLQKLDGAERARMKRQLLIMELYYQVLDERISAFE